MMGVLAIFHGLILFSIAFFVWRKQEAGGLRIFFWPALFFKLGAGIVLGLMYRYYYQGGDTYIFFRDAKQLSGLFRSDAMAYIQFLWSGNESHAIWASLSEIQPRSLFFTKIISVITVLTFDNYWITGLYLSFTSFLASWYFVKKILILFPDAKSAASFSVLFFPTVVFWSSGMIKESLAVAALFFLAGLFLTFMNKARPNVVEWVLLPVSLWMLWTLKYYWAAVFFPAFASTLIVYKGILPNMNPGKWIVLYLVWTFLFLVICSGAMVVHPNFYPEYFLQVIVDNNDAVNSLSDPQNLIHFSDLQPTWKSLLLNSPWALFSGLVRPFLFEGGNVVKLLYAAENSIVLILLLSSLWHVRRMVTSPFGILAFAVIMYAAILCIFLALSTPNFGTLARYRVGFLPFLIFLLTYRNPLLDKVWRIKRD
jgi:hypothetical protein